MQGRVRLMATAKQELMNAQSIESGSGADRVAGLVFTLVTLGEIGFGASGLVFPQVFTLLTGARLDAGGYLAVRMLGAAVFALGVTWWFARRDAATIARSTAGFLTYNFGVGGLFAIAALAASESALPWILCGVHLLAGTVFGAAFAASRSQRSAG